MAETVAAQRELVGSDAESDVANVEGLLAVEGGAGVYVRLSAAASNRQEWDIPPYGTVISDIESR